MEDYCGKYRDHCNGVLQWRREIRLNFEYSKENVNFKPRDMVVMAMGGGVVNGCKINKKKHQK